MMKHISDTFLSNHIELIDDYTDLINNENHLIRIYSVDYLHTKKEVVERLMTIEKHINQTKDRGDSKNYYFVITIPLECLY